MKENKAEKKGRDGRRRGKKTVKEEDEVLHGEKWRRRRRFRWCTMKRRRER